MAISFAAVAAYGGLAAAQAPPGVANSVERTIYLQKPAEGVVPAQAIAPPAPPPIFSPLSMPITQAPAVTGQPEAQPFPAPVKPPFKVADPKRDEVFRFDSDALLSTRIQKELADQYGEKTKVEMPALPTIASKSPILRSMPSMQVQIEPAYVVHRRLYFEEKNAERAGWDLGAAQPIASALIFYKDVVFYPFKLSSNLLEAYDTSAGKNLPGSPTPLLLYPPEITLFGAAVGTATIIGTAAVIP